MNSATIQILSQLLQHGHVDTWMQLIWTLCAACGWQGGNNMGWPGLGAGSVGSGAGAGASAGGDGSPSGGSPEDPEWSAYPGYGPFHWPDRCFPSAHHIDPSVLEPGVLPSITHWIDSIFNSPPYTDTTTAANGCSKA
jgi:hypothetical protein